MDTYFLDHMSDLSKRSEAKNIFTFSNFLNSEQLSELNMNKRMFVPFSLSGGAKGCERQMVRFGSEEELYYSEDFPIDCIKIEPLSKKFAEDLTHRDYLGAIMNLSIEREHIGDIIIREEAAYCFVTKKMSGFICENLIKIKHTSVKCTTCEFESNGDLFTLEAKDIISSSLRADCVICAVYNLSRSTADALFDTKKVYINSALCESSSKALHPSDTVSVRGFGKFIFESEISSTKKGRLKLRIQLYK
ncbi:MAG: hypothetical protein IJE93_06175 [Clostridia bacterium]|nr:hypothetical protein [Clostridia bacterium]